jgi:hypothetical protein
MLSLILAAWTTTWSAAQAAPLLTGKVLDFSILAMENTRIIIRYRRAP